MLLAEQLAPNKFRVIDFSIDPKSGSLTSFRRDNETHKKKLQEFFRRTRTDYRRFNYLGEWHSHPLSSVHPSAQDVSEMTDLVGDRASSITFAVLLIVRLRFGLWLEASATLFARERAPMRIKIGGIRLI
jgi:hypothetical protein